MSKLLIFTDGASRGNPGYAGAGFVVQQEDKKILLQQAIFLGKKTNNEAEYLAFLASLLWLEKQEPSDVENIVWHLDSKLVVEQINRNWKIKQAHLQQLVNLCWKILDKLPYPTSVIHIGREKNVQADILANTAMDLAQELHLFI